MSKHYDSQSFQRCSERPPALAQIRPPHVPVTTRTHVQMGPQWVYQESRRKQKAWTEQKYLRKLRDLQRKTYWSNEELENLKRYLEPLGLAKRMEHLEILHQIPRNFIDYEPKKTTTKSRAARLPPKTPETTPSRTPWKFEVNLFMGNSRRIPPNIPPEVTTLRQMNDRINRLMLNHGWCRSTIQLIRQAFHVPGLHLAMLLCPPNGVNGAEPDHSTCSRTQCHVLQVDRQTHSPSHVLVACCWHCDAIGVDTREVDRILQQNEGIPRFVLPLYNALPSKLRVSERGPFIAVSHVWAHGFGNSDNTMPACQLDRLRDFLRDLPGRPVLYQVWMDVLCVPKSNHPSKVKALSRIARTFRDAEKVVVLDAKLLSISCRVSPFEQCIRILSSDWIRRLWTLEEAMLGCANIRKEKLFFRFADGFVTLKKLLSDLRGKHCPYAHSAVLALERHLTLRLVPDWRIWLPVYDSTPSRFAQLARALEYRSTSKVGDEMLCMASILGLPTLEIIDARTPEDKAIAFYRALEEVPISILFCNGVRISQSPFHWAPLSFIAAEDPRKLFTLSKFTTHFGRCEADGLHVSISGIIFGMDFNGVANFNRIWLDPDGMSLEPLGWGSPYEIPEWQSWAGILQARADGRQVALMVNPTCDHEGVILRPIKMDKDRCHAEFLCQVHIRYARKRDSTNEEPMWRPKVTDDDEADGGGDEDADEEDDEEKLPMIVQPPLQDAKKSIRAWCRARTEDEQKWLIT